MTLIRWESTSIVDLLPTLYVTTKPWGIGIGWLCWSWELSTQGAPDPGTKRGDWVG